jgi:hypothetical protein
MPAPTPPPAPPTPSAPAPPSRPARPRPGPGSTRCRRCRAARPSACAHGRRSASPSRARKGQVRQVCRAAPHVNPCRGVSHSSPKAPRAPSSLFPAVRPCHPELPLPLYSVTACCPTSLRRAGPTDYSPASPPEGPAFSMRARPEERSLPPSPGPGAAETGDGGRRLQGGEEGGRVARVCADLRSWLLARSSMCNSCPPPPGEYARPAPASGPAFTLRGKAAEPAPELPLVGPGKGGGRAGGPVARRSGAAAVAQTTRAGHRTRGHHPPPHLPRIPDMRCAAIHHRQQPAFPLLPPRRVRPRVASP